MEPKAAPTPYIINTGNNSSAAKYLVIAAIVGGGLYFGKQAYDQYKKNKGEEELDTPAGQIAMQLKAVFDPMFPDKNEFKRVYVQVNNTNKDDVFKAYKLIAGRNLSDDMAKLPPDVVSKAAKVEEINNKQDGVIRIDSGENIQFLVAKGSKVVITNPAKAVNLYATPKGLLWFMSAPESKPAVSAYEKIKATVINRKDVHEVDAVQTLSYNGVKLATDWTKLFRPFVNTRKVYAIVRIKIKATDGSFKYLWIDARELSKPAGMKGLGITDLAY
jgi:hypothetical protein